MTSHHLSSGSIGLQRLLQEPQKLSDEIEKINTELESLIIENYKVFVENLTCSIQLQTEEEKLEQVSTKIETAVQNLQSVCQSFKERVQTYVQFHKRNRKTLQHHLQLLELLEVPQLVESCTRNGFFDEAIELANFVNGLERRHLLANEVRLATAVSGETPSGHAVIQTIVNEIQEILSNVQQQLLFQFTETNSLPKQIQMISVLRKLDSMIIDRFLSFERFESLAAASKSASHDPNQSASKDPQQIREEIRQHYLQTAEVKHQMDFLEAKNVLLQRNLESQWGGDDLGASSQARSGGSNTDRQRDPSASQHRLGPYGKAIELVEVYRTSLYSIAAQFTALFGDPPQPRTKPAPSSSSSTARQPPVLLPDAAESSLAQLCEASPTFSSRTILRSWVTRQVAHFLAQLRVLVGQIEEGNSVRSVFEQVLFFAARMSSVGADFTPLALPVFEELALAKARREMAATFAQFLTILQHEKITADLLAGTDSLSVAADLKEQLIPLFHAQDAELAGSSEVRKAAGPQSKSTGDVPPPPSLMKFPPLAFLLNNSLATLSFFREFPLTTLFPAVSQLLLGYLDQAVAYLVEHSAALRERGAKFFGDGFMAPIRSAARAEGGRRAEKLDLLYAEALAFDLAPHLLLCLLLAFRRLPLPTATAFLAKNQRNGHLLDDLRQGKEVLGPALADRLEAFWTALLAAKLLQPGQFVTSRTFRPQGLEELSANLALPPAQPVPQPSPVPTLAEETESRTAPPEEAAMEAASSHQETN